MKTLNLTILLALLLFLTSCSKDDNSDFVQEDGEEITNGDQGGDPQGNVVLNVDPNAIPGFVDGTAYVVSDIISASDQSTFTGKSYLGTGTREIFDRRINGFTTVTVFLVELSFEEGFTVEAQIHNEFGNSGNALNEAEKYGYIFGQLPKSIRANVNDITIMKGDEDFGGGDGNILIHTDRTSVYEQFNALEEIILHEGVHAAIDAIVDADNNWVVKQNADNNFISVYAKQNPTREDVAESFVAYLAARVRPEYINESTGDIIDETIANRMAYFDNMNLDFYPLN